MDSPVRNKALRTGIVGSRIAVTGSALKGIQNNKKSMGKSRSPKTDQTNTIKIEQKVVESKPTTMMNQK